MLRVSMSMPYGPDGSVLPAMVRLQRRDKLCWAVIKFVPSPAELAPDGVVWRSPGKCFSVESFGEKKDGGIADWSRFVASLPDDECRIGLFRFDFRAVRKFVLASWSPKSTKIALWDDTKIWDIRKQVQLPHGPATVHFMLVTDTCRVLSGASRRDRSKTGRRCRERPKSTIGLDCTAARVDGGRENPRHLCSRISDTRRVFGQAA